MFSPSPISTTSRICITLLHTSAPSRSGSSLQSSSRCHCRCHASPSDQACATLSDQTSTNHTRMDDVVTADNGRLTKTEPRGVCKFEILGRLRYDFWRVSLRAPRNGIDKG